MGVYEVERTVAKRKRGGKDEYFIQWKDYSTSENSWEPAEHLAEDLVAAFEKRSVDPIRADECTERLALLFERSLKAPLACNETIAIRLDVLRVLFPEMLCLLGMLCLLEALCFLGMLCLLEILCLLARDTLLTGGALLTWDALLT